MPIAPSRVLIVDDHPDAAESLAIVLDAGGFEVRTALDGESALATIEQWRPRVALLDLDLPGLDGFEVARRVRAKPWGGAMRLVAVTGYGGTAERESSRKAGFDAHLTKPVDPGRLLEWLSAVAEGRDERAPRDA